MKTEWCECMDMALKYDFPISSNHGKPFFYGKEWKFCPICGKERPSESKKLAEIIEDKYLEDEKTISTLTSAKIAGVCVDAVCEVIDHCSPDRTWANDLKKAIRDTLL